MVELSLVVLYRQYTVVHICKKCVALNRKGELKRLLVFNVTELTLQNIRNYLPFYITHFACGMKVC